MHYTHISTIIALINISGVVNDEITPIHVYDELTPTLIK